MKEKSEAWQVLIVKAFSQNNNNPQKGVGPYSLGHKHTRRQDGLVRVSVANSGRILWRSIIIPSEYLAATVHLATQSCQNCVFWLVVSDASQIPTATHQATRTHTHACRFISASEKVLNRTRAPGVGLQSRTPEFPIPVAPV